MSVSAGGGLGYDVAPIFYIAPYATTVSLADGEFCHLQLQWHARLYLIDPWRGANSG